MVVNGVALLAAQPIRNMLDRKVQHNGVSHGLSEVGYDIRLKQDIQFTPDRMGTCKVSILEPDTKLPKLSYHRFTLASAIEEFHMPSNLMGVVHDKSTWARHGLTVLNTVIEPGWKGFLTLELIYHGWEILRLPAGSGIAQVVFHRTECSAEYDGKYQNQADRPVEAITDWQRQQEGFPYG